ncbi:AraC family transcriptional regulator [Microbulbifer sp. SAOS-129_SWC]|uniref:AraC family transcriptional regulator n=1 Tax=Microbulbifer sp. SAOS-129_SWC TaxID=3145235 RepID=UPI003217FB9E
MTSLIRAATLQGYADLVTRLNGDPDALLRRVHINPNTLHELDGVISLQAHLRLLEETARELQCADFGLRLAECQDLMVLGPLAVAALGEKDARAALLKISELMHFHSPGLAMKVQPNHQPGIARLDFELRIHALEYRQFIECALGVAQKAVQMLCGDHYRPHRVLLDFSSPLPQACYQQYFSAPVYPDAGHNALEFSDDGLSQPLPRNEHAMNNVMEQFVRDTIGERSMELVERVRLLIMSLLPTGRCSLKIVALQLGFNPRTLQRRLAEESVSFQQLADQLRRQCAENFLAEVDMPLVQVAGLIGYTDQSSFNRACQRWFDATPQQYREQLSATARTLIRR